MKEEMSRAEKILGWLKILIILLPFALVILVILLSFTPAIFSEIFRKRREKIEEVEKNERGG